MWFTLGTYFLHNSPILEGSYTLSWAYIIYGSQILYMPGILCIQVSYTGIYSMHITCIPCISFVSIYKGQIFNSGHIFHAGQLFYAGQVLQSVMYFINWWIRFWSHICRVFFLHDIHCFMNDLLFMLVAALTQVTYFIPVIYFMQDTYFMRVI